jgi:hypothetical protein
MMSGSKKIWELTKRYDRAEFTDDESCVGYAVDVYQESINKTIREYLVNYTYLTRVLENYGFVLASAEDLRNLHADFTAPTGDFRYLFNTMNEDIKKHPRAQASYKEAPFMTADERTISFLNRYFIYKKVRKVSNTEKIALNLQHKTTDEFRDEITTAKQAVSKALAETAQAKAQVQAAKEQASAAKEQASAAKEQASAAAKEQAAASKKPTKKNTLKNKVLSTIAEGTEAPLVAESAEAPPAMAEKPTVTKVKRTLKIKEKI